MALVGRWARAGTAWRTTRHLELVQDRLPDEVLAARPLERETLGLDIAADRHHGYAELLGSLLEGKQLVSLVHDRSIPALNTV